MLTFNYKQNIHDITALHHQNGHLRQSNKVEIMGEQCKLNKGYLHWFKPTEHSGNSTASHHTVGTVVAVNSFII